MATTARDGNPYVWVTWITGILAGERECVFAPWFRSHFRYDKLEDSSFNSAAWTTDHSALVRKRADELKADGWAVSLESENQFRWHGHTAVLGGKPDIVARKQNVVLVVDAKTGKQRKADWWQVLVYLVALPRCDDDLKGDTLRGEVCYREHRIPIEPEELTAERREDIYRLLRTVGADERLPKTPNPNDCRFCDIADCEDRYRESDEAPTLAAEF